MKAFETSFKQYRELVIVEINHEKDSVFLPPIAVDGKKTRPRNDLFLMGKAVADNLGYLELTTQLSKIIR